MAPELLPSLPSKHSPLLHRRHDTVAILLALGLCAATALYLWFSYRQTARNAEVATQNLVAVVESRLAADFARINGILTILSEDAASGHVLPEGPPTQVLPVQSPRLARLIAGYPSIAVLHVFDAQGDLQLSSQSSPQRLSVLAQPYFQRLRGMTNATSPLYSPVMIPIAGAERAVVIARAARTPDGRLIATIHAVLRLTDLDHLFRDIHVGPQGAVILRRADDFSLVLRSPDTDDNAYSALPPGNPIRRQIESGTRQGTLYYKASTDGINRIGSFKRVDNSPFYVQVALSEASVFEGWRHQVFGAVIGLFLLGGLFLFATWRDRRISRQQSATLQRLKESEERYRLVQDAIGSGIWDWDLITGMVTWDDGMWRILRRTPLERPLHVDEIWSMVHPEDETEARTAIAQNMRVGGRFTLEIRMRTGLGDWRWVQVKGQLVARDAAGAPLRMAGTLADIDATIHEKHRADEALNRLRKVTAHVPGMVYQFQFWPDGHSAFPYASAGIQGIYAVTPEQVAQDASLAFQRLHPEDLPTIVASISESAETLETWHQQYRVVLPDGRLLWLEGEASPERQPDGSTLWHGYIRDMTARKHDEQANADLMEQLRRSNEDLEQFAYVASHDLRQPLRMIASYTQLLNRGLDASLDADQREYMGHVIDGARRMDQMLVSLLEYSRVGRKGEPMAPLDSRAALNEALLFLSPQISESGADIVIIGDWPDIIASRDAFTRLLQNLIGNALKYRLSGQNPRVTVAFEDLGDAWRISVTDNGIGIAPEHFPRLFKVFQRLHGQGSYEGTGIGLAMARKIVEHHGGRIWVQSDGEGTGSTFRFTLKKHPAA